MSSYIYDAPELKDLARENGDLFYYGDAVLFEYDPPIYPETVLPSLRKRIGEYQAARSYVVEIPTVALYGPYSLPVKDSKVIKEAVVTHRAGIVNLYRS